MKKQFIFFYFCLLSSSVLAQGSWVQKADFGGAIRDGAVGFSIGTKGYIGTGIDNGTNFLYQDFWEYNPSSNSWTQKANFGGGVLAFGVGFSIGNLGYVGTGAHASSTSLKIFWEYNPISNTWTQKADFAGLGRAQAVGFSIGNKGYVGTGLDGSTGTLKDFWQYDPANNTWVQKTDFGGTKRNFSVGFSIGGKGYLGTGFDMGTYYDDFWEYDTLANGWTQKANFGGGLRRGASGFSIGSNGYVGTGEPALNDFWEYNTSNNTWTQVASFGGAGRHFAVGFSIGSRGYIGTGLASISPFKDFWEYSTQAPKVTSFTPQSGPIGTSVTITGINFNAIAANNIVFFGATQATVLTASTTSLTVTVPLGASYQPISVTESSTNLTAYTAQPFVVTFPCGGAVDQNTFELRTDHASGPYGSNIFIGDLDGDAKPDLAASSYSFSVVSVHRNTSTTGTISISPKIDFTVGNQPAYISGGDLDGDGKLDLAVLNSSSNSVSILRNTSSSGNISFATQVLLATGSGPTSIAISDFDADGKSDLVITNVYSNSVSVFRNTGSIGIISFDAKIDFTTGSSPRCVVAGDFDGDERPDLSISNNNSNTISILRNTCSVGNISFAAKVDLATAAAPNDLALGDLDGDGKQDIVVVNEGSWIISAFRNTCTMGVIAFAAKTDYTNGGSVAIGDLDGDGKPDLASQTSGSNMASVLKNNSTTGNISFAVPVNYATGVWPLTIAIGDLDGDGKYDLTTANLNGSSISTLRSMAGVGQIMTSASAATICSGNDPNIVLTSLTPSSYTWIASDNPNTSGESAVLQNSGTINDVIINNYGSPQTVTYTVIPTTTSGSCVGSPQTVEVSVHPLPVISFVSKPDTCTGGVGKITASISSGTSPYSYLWSNNGTMQAISNLSPATYSLTVHDANSCSISASVGVGIFTSTISPTLTTLPDTCTASAGAFSYPTGGTAPYSFVWNNGSLTGQSATGLAAGNYTLTITDKNGCTASALTNVGLYTSSITPALTSTPDTCTGNVGVATSNPVGGTAPYTYAWSNSGTDNNIGELGPNSYSVTITDKNGCSVSASTNVGLYTSTITPALTSTPDTCTGNAGVATSNPVGGTAPYSYAWSNNGTNQGINSLIPGNYSVTITDKNGCSMNSSIIVGSFTSTITISFSSVSASCQIADGSLTANPSGGTNPYSFVWLGGNSSQTANNLLAGNYTVNVTDKNGCTATDTSFVGTNNVIATPAVCMVTVDSISKNNVIMWDKSGLVHIDSFIVFREIGVGNYQPIGAVQYNSLSLFVDTVRTKYFPNTGDPNAGTYRYKLGMKDSCGNISLKSPYHNTIYILNNSGAFSWTQHYTIESTANPVISYILMRDDLSNGNWHAINSVSGTQQNIIDPNYLTYQTTGSWRVETQWSISCIPTQKDPQILSFNSSRSNIYSLAVTGDHEYYNNPLVSIYPNPTIGEFNVYGLGPGINSFEIFDMFGKRMFETTLNSKQVTLHPLLSSGMYFYKVSSDGATIATGKLVIK